MEIIKKIVLLILVIIVSGYFSIFAINLYDKFFNSGSAFVQLAAIAGLPLAYAFFLPLLFTAFGGAKKYWWIGILLLPAVAFEVYFDFSHIYFPIALGLAGWLLGLLVCRLKAIINHD